MKMNAWFSFGAKLFLGLFLFSATSLAMADTVNTPGSLYYPGLNTVIGNPHGKVTLVEFFDYRCHYCRQIPAVLAQVMQRNPDVRVVFRDEPVLGPASELAAQAAVAASLQGKYYPYHNALLSTDQPLDKDIILAIAKNKGLNVNALMREMASARVNQQLRMNQQLADSLGVQGVPTFVIAATPARNASNVPASMIISPSADDLNAAIRAAE